MRFAENSEIKSQERHFSIRVEVGIFKLPQNLNNAEKIQMSIPIFGTFIKISFRYLYNHESSDTLRVPVACQISSELIFWYVKSNLNFYKQKLVASLFHELFIQQLRFEMPVLSESRR